MKQIKLTLMIVLLFVFVTTQAQARQILPDGLGYSTIDSNEVGGPIFGYDDISATGTREDLNDDGNAPDVPIGFTFNFYGIDYTTLSIASNSSLMTTSVTRQIPTSQKTAAASLSSPVPT